MFVTECICEATTQSDGSEQGAAERTETTNIPPIHYGDTQMMFWLHIKQLN